MGIHKVCSWVKIVRILHSLFQDNTFLPEFWLCTEIPPKLGLFGDGLTDMPDSGSHGGQPICCSRMWTGADVSGDGNRLLSSEQDGPGPGVRTRGSGVRETPTMVYR